MNSRTLQQWSCQLHQALKQSNQRIIVDCEGDWSWGLQIIRALADNKKSLVLSDQVLSDQVLIDQDMPPSLESVAISKSIQLLGQEFEVIVYDAFSGFDVDAFTRALGLIKAPGLLLLVHPDNKQWLLQHDVNNTWQNQQQGQHYFLSYLQSKLSNSEAVLQCQQNKQLSIIHPLKISPSAKIKEPSLLTQEQLLACASFHTIFDAKEKSFALLAPRGRGKSTLLGRWLRQKQGCEKKFIITSNSKKAAGHCLRFKQQLDHVNYLAIDHLLSTRPYADCIIVDEAATLPVALLFALKQQYKRIIYTSTLDGYEGTGQGFEQQFLASFKGDALPIIKLSTPIRWGSNDVLEAWMEKTFLLSRVDDYPKQQAPVAYQSLAYQELAYQKLAQQDLSRNNALLQQVFQLLKTSHYRTQASDLRMLLDNPDITLFVAIAHFKVIGVMLLTAEGGLKRELSQAIYYGKRRPQGHLLAQGLTVHAGCKGFAELTGFRVQRIAVAEAFRRLGIGSCLIELGLEHAKRHQAAYLGAVFALDENNIKFWQRNKMCLVMLSVGRGTSTGQPSLTMLLAIKKKAELYKEQCLKGFKSNFSERLLTHYKNMPASLVLSLLTLMPSLGVNNKKQCDAYINGHKGFEYALSDLRRYVLYCLQHHKWLHSNDDRALLVRAILQYQAWPEIIKSHSLSGKKELQQRLKTLLRAMVR